MHSLSVDEARRLALLRAGLLKPEWLNLPQRAAGHGERARRAALAHINHLGYLQLDTVSIAGARSHALVMYSRIRGMDPALGEALLQPEQPLFEYWGHEVCWLPNALYPLFGFRRREFQTHPWWGDLIRQHPKVAADLRRQISAEGPLRSLDMEGQGSSGWWNLKLSKKVATALWSAGELAVVERRNFQRSFDLTERVIPDELRAQDAPDDVGIAELLVIALASHGWATTSTLVQTWRLKNRGTQVKRLLDELTEAGRIAPCELHGLDTRPVKGWIRPEDLEWISRLKRLRPRTDQGVLLSPFDPLLWDRNRVQQLFNFHQILEIFKPAPQREYGYYCLPVLAGEALIARFDLKAHRNKGQLQVISCRFEDTQKARSKNTAWQQAAQHALTDYAETLALQVVGWK